ncbi:MAG: 1,4-alpha-glucan branching enzyme, partial [Gemmatimonadaceae bacterium]|nr:1,4-alpha-glucan branching enzyme [Gemmatimonadaceae bacterium]
HDKSLDWHLLHEPERAAFSAYLARLGAVYREHPALWRRDGETQGFEWIDVSDRDNSVLSYLRWSDEEHVVVILNLTPAPHPGYRIGVPAMTEYARILSTDDPVWGGSGYGAQSPLPAHDIPYHGRRYSIELDLPPLSAIVLAPARGR